MTARVALVTGASGFLGGHVAAALRERGWRVRALARSVASRAALASAGNVEIVPGDLSLPDGLADAARGCGAIVHLAGVLKARTLEDYRAVNARGTERLVAAARETAPDAMLVHVSTQAAAGPALGGIPVAPSDPPRPVSWYGQSKLEGEEIVRTGWRGPWIVLRPGVVYGAGDRGLLTYFRMAASGFVPVPAAGRRIQIGGAPSMALAIASAAARGDLSGRTAFLCDPDPVTIGRLAALVVASSGRRARLFPIPDVVVRAAGLAETVREAITRRSRPFNADKARELLAGEWLCESGLRRELALPDPLPLEEGLRATWDWYRRAGWLNL